jgi:hypothetical protein
MPKNIYRKVILKVIFSQFYKLFTDFISYLKSFELLIFMEESSIVSMRNTKPFTSRIYKFKEFFQHFPWRKSYFFSSCEIFLQFSLRE